MKQIIALLIIAAGSAAQAHGPRPDGGYPRLSYRQIKDQRIIREINKCASDKAHNYSIISTMIDETRSEYIINVPWIDSNQLFDFGTKICHMIKEDNNH